MDILQEYYKIIENNDFRTLPDQELIDSDERVALAVWKNYVEDCCYNRYEDETYFKYITDWVKILHHYKEDISFWKKAGISSELFDSDFERCFPVIYKSLVNDREYLLEKYESEHSNQSKYFALIEKLEGSNLIFKKKFLLENIYEVDFEKLRELQDDTQFLLELMKKDSTTYRYLNSNLKEDDRFLKLAAKKYNSFILLNEEQQVKYVEDLLNSSVSVSDLKKLSESVRNRVMEVTTDPYIIIHFFKQDKGYRENLLSAINRDTSGNLFIKVISDLDEKTLKSLFKNNLNMLQPKLDSWLKSLSIEKFSNYDVKIISLTAIDLSFRDKLNKSYEYNLSIVKNDGQRITVDFFKEYVESLFNRMDSGEITRERAERDVVKAKKLLPVELLKELRLQDKGILNYFLFEKLNKTVNNNNGSKPPKLKI